MFLELTKLKEIRGETKICEEMYLILYFDEQNRSFNEEVH